MKLTAEQFNALHRYAMRHGHNWKADLRGDWIASHYFGIDAKDTPLLQQVRNNLGPSWLTRFSLRKDASVYAEPLSTAARPLP